MANREVHPDPAWIALGLRLTVFPSEGIDPKEAGWWADVVGSDPDVTATEGKGLKRVERGAFEGGYLVAETQPHRIDWYLRASEEPGMLTLLQDPGSVPSLDVALERFRPPVLAWLGGEPVPVSRMAVGMELYQPCETREEGYELLDDLIPAVTLDGENTSEFTYRINRPRDSTIGVPGLRINRLSTWSVVKLSLSVQQVGVEGAEVELGTEHAARVELDVNTVPQPDGLPADRLVDVFEELATLGSEIAGSGDIP